MNLNLLKLNPFLIAFSFYNGYFYSIPNKVLNEVGFIAITEIC